MSPVSTLPRPRRLQVLPGFGLSLGLSLFFVALVLLLPLTGLVMNVARLSLTDYWAMISDAQVLATFRVTLWQVNAVCGLLLAWVPVRYRLFGWVWLMRSSICRLPCRWWWRRLPFPHFLPTTAGWGGRSPPWGCR